MGTKEEACLPGEVGVFGQKVPCLSKRRASYHLLAKTGALHFGNVWRIRGLSFRPVCKLLGLQGDGQNQELGISNLKKEFFED